MPFKFYAAYGVFALAYAWFVLWHDLEVTYLTSSTLFLVRIGLTTGSAALMTFLMFVCDVWITRRKKAKENEKGL